MSQDKSDDLKILKLIKKSPSKGLSQLMKKYTGLVYHIVSQRLIDRPQDIEECVSDVFVEFYEKIDNIDLEKGSITKYISMIASRRAIDKYRKITSTITTNADDIEEMEGILSDGRFTPEDSFVNVERNELLRKELKNLGEPDHEILVRRYFFNESVKEIADRFGMKSNSVTKRIGRALELLKQRLGEYYYG